MKVVGFFLILVGVSAMDHGGGVTWGQVAMIIIGAFMIFPNLIGYLFDGERK